MSLFGELFEDMGYLSEYICIHIIYVCVTVRALMRTVGGEYFLRKPRKAVLSMTSA